MFEVSSLKIYARTSINKAIKQKNKIHEKRG